MGFWFFRFVLAALVWGPVLRAQNPDFDTGACHHWLLFLNLQDVAAQLSQADWGSDARALEQEIRSFLARVDVDSNAIGPSRNRIFPSTPTSLTNEWNELDPGDLSILFQERDYRDPQAAALALRRRLSRGAEMPQILNRIDEKAAPAYLPVFEKFPVALQLFIAELVFRRSHPDEPELRLAEVDSMLVDLKILMGVLTKPARAVEFLGKFPLMGDRLESAVMRPNEYILSVIASGIAVRSNRRASEVLGYLQNACHNDQTFAKIIDLILQQMDPAYDVVDLDSLDAFIHGVDESL